ncbi:hypothetical protein ACWENR_23020 [Micromonospora sp. NPDC004336]
MPQSAPPHLLGQIPRLGGGSVLGMGIPSVTLNIPNIPYLAKGGHILNAGTAIVGERGPELLELPVGATVRPLSGERPRL